MFRGCEDPLLSSRLCHLPRQSGVVQPDDTARSGCPPIRCRPVGLDMQPMTAGGFDFMSGTTASAGRPRVAPLTDTEVGAADVSSS